jgi:uncharacterized protein (TIGR02996 family)
MRLETSPSYPPGAEPFLRAIREAPLDDAPRLIFADWLDEQGFAERAEFIRLQIEAARTEPDDVRQFEIETRLAELGQDGLCRMWAGHLPLEAITSFATEHFERGFFEQIRLSATDALVHAPRVMDLEPATTLAISGPLTTGESERLREAPWLSGIRHLRLASTRCGDEAAIRCLESPHLNNPQTIDLSDCGIGIPTVDFLAESELQPEVLNLAGNPTLNWEGMWVLACREWTNLHTLNLSGTFHHLRGLEAFFEAENFPNLRTLSLQNCMLDAESIAEFSDSPLAKQLVALDLAFNNIRGPKAVRLARRRFFPQLRRLYLVGSGTSRDAAFQMAMKGDIPFRTLHLCTNMVEMSGFGDREIEALSTSDLIAEIRSLSLANNSISESGFWSFGRHAVAPKIWRLDLSYNAIGLRFAGDTFRPDCPAFAGLKWLSLSSSTLTDYVVARLVTVPQLAGLRYLNLSGNQIGPDGAASLCASPHLSDDLTLDLSGNRLQPYDLQKLRERFSTVIFPRVLPESLPENLPENLPAL